MKKIFTILFLLFILVSCETPENTKTIDHQKLHIAVFKGNGAGAISVIETIEALRIDSGIFAQAISASEIQDGKLSGFDALIFPGGSGSKELNNLGKQGKQIVDHFIRVEGKGIVGICAGGYLLSSTSGYPNLQIASSVHIDRAHYNRGRGLVEFTLTEQGYTIFPELKDQSMFAQYYDGPVLVQGDTAKDNYIEVAQYVTDIHPDNFAPTGITPGSTFALNEEVGKGKVFIIAGHPESTPGMRWLIPRMARWVCNSELVSYDQRWVRPEINDSALLFTRARKKIEKKLFWELFSDSSEVQISAMNQLYDFRSRPAVRWNIGLLRDANPETRLRAAYLLMQTEYSYALPDLIAAESLEKNTEVKLMMQKAIKYLRY